VAQLTFAQLGRRVTHARMRYGTSSGWSVDVIRLIATPNHHDGKWLRVAYFGWH
jgi:hypothetical protein